MKLWVLPAHVWLPLALAALAPLIVMGLIVALSRRRDRGIAMVLTLRSILVLGVGFAMLAGVATFSVVGAGLNELQQRHVPEIRGVADGFATNPMGPASGVNQLGLALFRAKDPNVSFIVVGGDGCRTSCVMSVGDLPVSTDVLQKHLMRAWPTGGDDQHILALGERAFLLVSNPIVDAGGAPVAHAVTVVAGIDATSIMMQAARTAWILLGISYALLILVGWSSWHQVSRSLATRMRAISTELRSGRADESIEMLHADGRELRELADSVKSYINQTLEQQKSTDERHKRLIDLSPDAIFICSNVGIRFANSAAVHMSGVESRRELIGVPIARFLEILPRPTGVKRDVAVSALRPARWRRRDGTTLQVEVAEITDNIGDDDSKQYVVRDVTHQQAREADLTHRAEHDPLTGLVNRARFQARLTELVHTQSSRPTADPREAAVLFIDLDGFKPVNDQHGHAAGDAVLVAISERLRQATRGSDVVARLGGDEFAVLLDVRDRDELRMVANRVLGSMRQPVAFDAGLLVVAASIGVASVRPDKATVGPPSHSESMRIAHELVRAADVAMYAAKTAGKDQFHLSPYPKESTEDSSEVSFPAVA
ncbi:MAG: diguanylate cyclase [Gemmatimonadaceae bacterium]